MEFLYYYVLFKVMFFSFRYKLLNQIYGMSLILIIMKSIRFLFTGNVEF